MEETEADGDDFIAVRNDDALNGDSYVIFAQSFFPQTVEDHWIFASWGVGLFDPTATVFSDDGLPTELSREDFDNAAFLLGLVTQPDPVAETIIQGQVTAVRFVPESPTGFLFIAGLLGLGVAGPRRKSLG